LDRFLDISGFIAELVEAAGLSSAVVSPVVKTVGIGLITKLSSDICKDAGQNTAATVVESAGSIAAVTVALPLMKTVFKMISSLI
ncbi:MAG: stage III sporulation protein AD, partial [Clostridiales bacterium]|nr:stage III sporulation protein AD [Clostridiales bacterium]